MLASAQALAALTITPITWDVIGLDSNSPAVGPRHFPVGARICSPGTPSAGVVSASYTWDSANGNITLRPGSLGTIVLGPLAAGACADAYFEVEIQPNAAAYDTARRYHITGTDGNGSVSTPAGRQLFVEHLVSQSRNGVSDMRLNGVSTPAGGTMALVVGNTYTIDLVGATATQGYNQLESFINFSNTIFQILSVSTAYSANNSPFYSSPTTKLHADACGWDSNPLSPNYRSCVGGDYKTGGNVTTSYTVKIIGGGGSAQTLVALVYDFSGSSYHYNADYAAGARFASIIDPTSLTFAKAFNPTPTIAGGTSVLTFTIGNPNAGSVGGINFSDPLPGGMAVANPPNATTSGCGTPTFAPAAGATTLTFGNGTVSAIGTCTVSVKVTVPQSPLSGSYTNTSGNLFVGAVDTGKNAVASLGLTPAAPGSNTCGLTLAQWNMGVGAGVAPPAPSSKRADVTNATASSNATGSTINTTVGNPANSWSTRPYNVAIGATYVDFAVTTSLYNTVTFSVDAAKSIDGPTSLQLYYSVDGGTTFTAWGAAQSLAAAFATYGGALPVAANKSGDTVFRISATGANNAGNNANLFLDNVTIGGCQRPLPPTIGKAFSPSAIAVGGTSTLAFAVTNPNASTSLTGVSFTDSLPAGMQVAAAPNASTTCGGSPTWAPTAGSTSLTFGQPTGATLAAGGSCNVVLDVTLTNGGPHANVTSFIGATESGLNSDLTGSGSANLTGLVPPVIDKDFSPISIPVGGTSLLTLAVSNPNLSNALSGIAVSDTYPANLVNTNPLGPAPTNTCGGVLTVVAGGNSLALSGGILAAGANCLITVPVTSAVVGTYPNAAGVSSTSTGPGSNSATISLNVTTPHPTIGLSKKVATSATGPWVNFVTVTPGTQLWYQFIAENIGDVPLASFAVSDPQLAGTVADPATCSWVTTNVPSTLPGLPLGTPTVDPSVSCVKGPISAILGTVVNTATATGVYAATSYPSDPAQTTYLGANPGVTLIKQISTTDAGPWASTIAVPSGTSVYYRFTIVNAGAFPLSGISLTDPMVSSVASCSFIDPLPVGAATTCVSGAVTTSGAPGATVTNTATAAGTSGGLPFSANGSASYTLPAASADVSMVKTLTTAGPFAVGQSISYTLVVANAGPDAASNIQVSDTPSNLTIANVSGGGCSALPCTIPNLAAGTGTTIIVTATISAVGAFDNVASANATTADPNPANNTDSTGNGGTANASADVSLVKTLLTPAPYAVGQSVTYSIVVANAGPSTATSIQVTDTPTNLSITNVSGGGCSALPCTIASLAPGNSATVTATATITAAGAFDNVATATAAISDPNPSNNTDSTGNGGVASAAADIGVVKSNGTSSVLAGGTTTYTIVVSNAGPSAANAVQVVDNLPAAIASASWTASGAGGALCPASGSGSISTSVNLPSGASCTFTLIAAISPLASGTLTNTATATPPVGVTDSNPGNNSASDTDTVVAAPIVADLGVTKTNGAGSVTAGGSTAYTITVTNAGPDAVTGAILADPAVGGLAKTSVACSATPGQCSTPPTVAQIEGGTFALPALAAGATYQIVVGASVTAAAGSSIANVATIAVPSGATDPNPANNTATDTDTVVAVPIVADLAITKTNGATSVTAGGTTTYTITVTNNGPALVTGAVVTDSAVTGLAKNAVACSAAPGTCVTPPSVAALESGTFVLPALASGSTWQITVRAAVTASSGTVANLATIAPPAGVSDSNPGNNSATDSDTVLAASPLPDLTVAKSHTGNFTQGQAGATYTLVVSNVGAGATTAPAFVADALPSGLAATSIAGTGWSCTLASLSCTRSDLLAAGASYPPITLTVNVAANAPGSVVNTATVSGGGQTVTTNDTASDATTIVASAAPDLALTKSPVGTASSGSAGVTWLIVVANVGAGPTSGAVNVVDTLPAGFNVASLSGPGWACTVATVSCTRSDPLAAGASYPGITIVANVPPGAAGTATNVASVSGGGDTSSANNSSTSSIAIGPQAPPQIPTLDWSALIVLALGIALAGWHARRRAIG